MVEQGAVGAAGGIVSSCVLVCSDPGVTTMLRALLRDAGIDAVDVTSGRDALSLTAAERPALVMLDIDGPDAMGLVVCTALRDRYGDALPIVLVSGERTDTADRVAGLLLGADDYLVRPFETNEVVARLRRLLKRASAAAPTPSAEPAIDDFGLTPRERDVLTLLVQGRTQQEIARDLVISPNTVSTHIQRILLKLGVRTRAQAVSKAARRGWLARDIEGRTSTVDARRMVQELESAARETHRSSADDARRPAST